MLQQLSSVPSRAEVLARLASLVAEAGTTRPLSWRLCDACRQLLHVDSAAITLNNSTVNRLTVAATDDVAARIEDLQDVLEEGPGWDAFNTGRMVTTVFGHTEPRWPSFMAAVRGLPIAGSMFAVPMHPSQQVMGVLSLIRTGGPYLPGGAATAQFLSDAVGAALLEDPDAQAEYGEGGPWSLRAGIHQATGMVCAQLGIAPPDALALLKAHAYAHDTDLASVARMVLDRQIDFRGID